MKKIQLRHELIQDLLDSCNKKLEQDPDDTALLGIRALLFNLGENYQKGIDDLNTILERSPQDADMYILRADCLINLVEMDLAKQDYLRALQRKNPVELASMVEDYIITETVQSNEELKDMTEVILYEKGNIIEKLLPRFIEGLT